ncbi:30S ribosomal protein S5 [Candidatus Nitrosocosmicus franklandus]|uniref:Small ribosomal subunit protein uS5 n=1 Tax=Candidatus Nitrosocosmicus franklandianus TaxID=1798806 RepID=A0A484IEB0_9ARCH|nr:30S ribosomal protein S5 [Candidatus Nitrosocosmicus franklandus]VFJ15078.1 30S ribosomal protein S5 [Candidatus Nitrosocosmicus franklandus]
MSRMSRPNEAEVEWKPRTTLGMMVASGKINSMEQIFENGMRIQESEIVKHLLPDIKTQVVSVEIVQKQTDAGELTRFNALVAIGNESGWFGIGKGKASQMRNAIDKATNASYLNVIPVKLGCGSWECRCHQAHSVPFKVQGRGGSVKIELIPGPRGLGIVAGENIRNLLKLAGLKDCWSRSYGSTNTMSSTAKAIFNALRSTFVTG